MSTNRRGTSRRRVKAGKLYTVLLILFAGLFCFSAYKLADQLLVYKKGNDTYQDIAQYAVAEPESGAEEFWDDTVPAWNPEEYETSAAEPAKQSSAFGTEESSPVISDGTKEPTAEQTEAPSSAVQTAAATKAPAAPAKPVSMAKLNVDFPALKSRNPDVIAWLQGQGGNLSLPVVKGADNDYYLNHLFTGEQNSCGTLFADAQNSFLSDTVTYIYGHKMKNGSMFGKLEQYQSQYYYDCNPVMKLYMPDHIYTLQLFAGILTDTDQELHFNYVTEESFTGFVKDLKVHSTFKSGVSPVFGDKLVCLYTCAYHKDNGRYIIFAKVVP